MNSFFITTLGCHKNQADSRQISGSMRNAGFALASSVENADLHLINSCAFIESAREETIQTVLDSAHIRKSRAQKLVLVGCFSQRYEQDVIKNLPEVDFLFGTGKYHLAGELIAKKFGAPASLTKKDTKILQEIWAPVKIADGCNRACAFCAIPQMRGKFQPVDKKKIVQEVQDLVQNGLREVCLVSQDTNQFGSKVEDFIELIGALQKISNLAWIRLLYMYPDKRTLSIFRELARRGFSKLVPYLESPVQHTSPAMLKSMKRYVDPSGFEDFFGEVRYLFPEIEIRTSFLTGFPGEEDEDLEYLYSFLENIKPEKLALFSYSKEEGTAGYNLVETVTPEQKAKRNSALRTRHLAILKQHHKDRVGKVYECIVDRIESNTSMALRRPQDAPEIDELVFVENIDAMKYAPGSITKVKIDGFYEYDMTGTLV